MSMFRAYHQGTTATAAAPSMDGGANRNMVPVSGDLSLVYPHAAAAWNFNMFQRGNTHYADVYDSVLLSYNDVFQLRMNNVIRLHYRSNDVSSFFEKLRLVVLFGGLRLVNAPLLVNVGNPSVASLKPSFSLNYR